SPSRGFWRTKPQSVRASSRKCADESEARSTKPRSRVSYQTLPESGGSCRDTACSSVLLPDPDSPTTHSTSPGCRSKLMSRQPCTPSQVLVRPRTESNGCSPVMLRPPGGRNNIPCPNIHSCGSPRHPG